MTSLVAMLIVTNMVQVACPYCDRSDGIMLAVMHEHEYRQVVTTNYLPVVSKENKSMKQTKLIIKSSNDVAIEYSELCDCDEIYKITVCGKEFLVSYRYWEKMTEPQVWLFGDKDILIGTTKKLTKTAKMNSIKSMFISYMVGCGRLNVKE